MKKFIGYEKGVNLGGWLSQCCHTKEHYDSFITQEDIKKAASFGIDHVRLPIDYNLVEDSNGAPVEEGYKYIDSALEWCGKYGLNVVLDLHKTAGYSFDKGENENGFFEDEGLQQRFISLWEKLAKRYGKYSDRAVFELLNEVTEPKYSDTWNSLIYKAIEKIRTHAPDITVITGGYWQNSPDALPDIAKPYDDKVVLCFHCYDPLKFTHQGAPWVDGMDVNFRMPFPENEINTAFFEQRFTAALKTAEKYDAPLYCGEYGVIDRADPKDVLAWYKSINAAFLKYGISRCAWNFKEKDFGISDDWAASVIDELVKYL